MNKSVYTEFLIKLRLTKSKEVKTLLIYANIR